MAPLEAHATPQNSFVFLVHLELGYIFTLGAERGLFLSNTFFQHKMIHRYTWARGDKRSLIDYIAVDNRLRREVEDAKVVRGLFSGSDHFAVVAKVRKRSRGR